MRRFRVAVSVLAIATIVGAARCAPVQSQPKQVQANKAVTTGPPVIESARPDSVLLPYGGVVEVTLSGIGFVPGKPGQNTVHFNGTALRQVPASSDGRRIVFVVPDVVSHGGEAPPRPLRTGRYSVSVETISGTSNAVTIRVFR
jgi:hypothetical protein